MSGKTERNGAPKRMKWVVLSMLALALFFAASLVKETLRSRQIELEVRALKEEAERLRARNFEIASFKNTLENDEFLEREARLKLGLRKEGERVVVLVPSGYGQAQEARVALVKRDASEVEWTNAKKWWSYFFDRGSYDAYRERDAP